MELNEEEREIVRRMGAKMNRSRMYKIEDKLWQGGVWSGMLPEEFDAILTLSNEPPEFELGEKVWLWIPIDDGPFPGLKWLQMVVNMVADMLDAGRTVYIHCHAGISRSTMVTAAYLMMKHNWDHEKALNHIAITNPTVDPNPHFIRGLKEWRKYLQTGK